MKIQTLIIVSLIALTTASITLAAPDQTPTQKQSAAGATTSAPHEEGSNAGGAPDLHSCLTAPQLNLFRQIDRDGDGVINKEEFARFLAANPDSGLRLTEGAASRWAEPLSSKDATGKNNTPAPAPKPWAPPAQHGGNDDAGPQSSGDTRDSAGRPAR